MHMRPVTSSEDAERNTANLASSEDDPCSPRRSTRPRSLFLLQTCPIRTLTLVPQSSPLTSHDDQPFASRVAIDLRLDGSPVWAGRPQASRPEAACCLRPGHGYAMTRGPAVASAQSIGQSGSHGIWETGTRKHPEGQETPASGGESKGRGGWREEQVRKRTGKQGSG